MKKTFLILLTAVIFAACTAPTTNHEATSSTNANMATETKAAAPLSEAEATAKEKELWDTIAKQNLDAFAASIADDQIYVSNDGVHDKASTIKGVTGFIPSDVVFSDWKFVPIDKDATLATYMVKIKGTMNGTAFRESSAYASSLWVNRGGKWVALFHQDSDVLTMPPPPAKAEKAMASPGATAATPAAPGADVEANEKAVWASLTARQFNVFESFLAPDFIEVEPFGVTDRAASVKGVQAFDFSKSSLSDWKTVKIDDDASIVTYIAHFPGQKPDTEYHSSVWAKRDGKWIAVFHQGTHKASPQPAPAAKPAATK